MATKGLQTGVDEANRGPQRSLDQQAASNASAGTSIERRDVLKMLTKVSVCTASGMVFGIAAEKGQAHVPSVIISQMRFSQFTMLKLFLSAVASSTLVFSFISLVTSRIFKEISLRYINGLKTQHIMKTIIGAAILGAGMSLCGSCPGMVLVQIGSATQNAAFSLAGCLAGAVLYGITDPFFPSTRMSSDLDHYVHTKFRVPYIFLGVPFAVLLGSVVIGVEYYIPWTTETPVVSSAASILAQKLWNPTISGTLIGILQIPIVFFIGDTLGSSSAYCTVLSQVFGQLGLLSNRSFAYFRRFSRGNWWQVFYVAGAIAGGYLSASMSGSLGVTEGVTPVSAFVGGVCMLLGARTASGCTSGHGISGMGLLAVHSILAVPAMFVGGIATALLLHS